MSRFSTRLLPIVTLLALAGTARAQQPPPGSAAPPPRGGGWVVIEPDVRSGWNFGGGLGGGNISCEGECPDDDVIEAGGLDLRVGYMLRPRLNVVGTIFAMGHSEDQWSLTHTIVTGGITYWIIDRLWVHGGIGFASARLEYDGPFVDAAEQTENVFALAGAIGFEILSRRKWSLDLALRGGTGFYDDLQARNQALTIDFTLY